MTLSISQHYIAHCQSIISTVFTSLDPLRSNLRQLEQTIYALINPLINSTLPQSLINLQPLVTVIRPPRSEHSFIGHQELQQYGRSEVLKALDGFKEQADCLARLTKVGFDPEVLKSLKKSQPEAIKLFFEQIDKVLELVTVLHYSPDWFVTFLEKGEPGISLFFNGLSLNAPAPCPPIAFRAFNRVFLKALWEKLDFVKFFDLQNTDPARFAYLKRAQASPQLVVLIDSKFPILEGSIPVEHIDYFITHCPTLTGQCVRAKIPPSEIHPLLMCIDETRSLCQMSFDELLYELSALLKEGFTLSDLSILIEFLPKLRNAQKLPLSEKEERSVFLKFVNDRKYISLVLSKNPAIRATLIQTFLALLLAGQPLNSFRQLDTLVGFTPKEQGNLPVPRMIANDPHTFVLLLVHAQAIKELIQKGLPFKFVIGHAPHRKIHEFATDLETLKGMPASQLAGLKSGLIG